ncbi:MAG: PEP-CTERM sorting domain-containing protein [Pseudomonadales bacterium]|nr:PEP-CTERM sorting domain-containing protein [Pseudomonadales bacterium]
MMFKNLTKASVLLAALVGFSTAQALPLSGEIEFVAKGLFIDDGTNVHGVDWNPQTGSILEARGGFATVVAVPGSAMVLSDFDLRNPPPLLEWTISPVTISGVTGDLIFEILNGGEIDIADAGGVSDLGTINSIDLGGQGQFSFTCTDTVMACAGLNSATDAIDTSIGRWQISETQIGDFLIAVNVPAPASIGILGVGLLGLSAFRRRKMA